MNNPLVYKWLSVLLCYPEADLIEALPEFQTALNEWPELHSQKEGLQAFLDYLGSHNLRELQEYYVANFDRNRHQALYLFEHVYGEDRDRGSAMVDLLEEYRRHGFELGDEELPDYLPALLEFFSCIEPHTSQKLLDDAVHVIAHIARKLHASHSPYAVILDTAAGLSRVEPKPLVEPPVRDMDEAMEMFGPDISGTEPLLKRSVETIQFYPKGSLASAHKGA